MLKTTQFFIAILLFLISFQDASGQSNDFILTISCSETSTNLNTAISSSNLPTGTQLTWHTDEIASTANLLNNPTAATTGTYYAAFYDAADECYSPTAPFTVIKDQCLENICPSNTVDLTVISSSNQPSGTIPSYHTAQPVSNETRITDVTAIATSGTYYFAFYDEENDCYGEPVSFEVSIRECCTMVQPGISLSAN